MSCIRRIGADVLAVNFCRVAECFSSLSAQFRGTVSCDSAGCRSGNLCCICAWPCSLAAMSASRFSQ